MASKSFSQSFSGVPASLGLSRAFINDVLTEMGWLDREIDLQLAIGEVTQNVIRYGFQGGREDGEMTINITIDADKMICDIADNAPASNPDDWMVKAEARRPDEGGYGLSIIQAVAEEYSVHPSESGNVSHLVFTRLAKE